MFAKQLKNKQIMVKVTEEQHKAIKAMAEARNMTITDLILSLLEQEVKKTNG